MAAVTQRIDSYLGGVSRQSDDKKLPGQVRECLNAYPDPTFGLVKRPGFKWIKNLGTGTTYDDAKWFYIHRDNDEKYIGCITPKPSSGNGTIAVWNAATGVACTVTYGTGAQAYLTGARANYDVLTVQDTSIITNDLFTVAKQADPSFTENKQATLVLSGTAISSTYDVTVNGNNTGFPFTTDATETYDELLTQLKTKIDAMSISGMTTVKYNNTLQITCTSAFTISAKGGSANDKLSVFQNQVSNITQLPTQTFDGHIVKIQNTLSDDDTYFSKFIADNGTSGPGYWEETLDPAKSPGLDNTTMPHELVNTATNTFQLKKIDWTARLVGDDKTNSHPSFVGSKIVQGFFYNNRLGFLSSDNVSMSQSGEFFNFYHKSAQAVTDADPVDLSCATIRPAVLHGIIPTTQGLVLFSKNQQFLMSSADGILTPTTTVIKAISNYEMATDVDPVDMGTNINFISKTPSYTRIFGMVTRGQDENPQVLDVGRVVSEWVPATVDTFTASPQNQFIALSSQSDRKIYLYRTYADGEKLLVQSWFNWELPGTVQTIAVDSDDMFAVTKQGNQVTLSKANLSQSPDDAIIVDNAGNKVNPCMDLYAEASNGLTGGSLKTVVYDSTNDFSKCYIPWANVTGLTPVIIIKGTTATGQFIESGFTLTPEIASDSDGTYFKVPKKNLAANASDVIVGWKYDLDVILPKTYYRMDADQRRTDFTAPLTIARMNFAVGLSGVMAFKLKSTGIRQHSKEFTGDGSNKDFEWIEDDISYIDRDQIKVRVNNVEQQTTAFTFLSDTKIRITTAPAANAKVEVYVDEWYNLNPTAKADTYLANDIALANQSVFSIPIHQRTENFQLRVFNDSPFPVSLNSMMWEGNYTPRFYRRA